jgi:hypothetical protein
MSQQADSEERDEIYLQTDLIDLKNENGNPVDVYDLSV